MGTTYTVKVVHRAFTSHATDELKVAIDSELDRVNKLMSTYDRDSEISKFNLHSSTEPFSVSQDTMDVVRAARDLYMSTQGLFDPTVGPLVDLWGFGTKNRRIEPPPDSEIEDCLAAVGMDHLVAGPGAVLSKQVPELHLDLSAIAPGYGVDRVSALLEGKGYGDLMVEIGGEIVVRGLNFQRNPWRLGVDSPIQTPGRRNLVRILQLTDTGLATSGNYRNFFEYQGVRYTHVLNPTTGRPVPDSVQSVTIVAPTCMRADGAATAAMVLGATRGLDWVKQQADIEALMYIRSASGEVTELLTDGMRGFLSE